MTTTTAYCRICRGLRPFTLVQCTGCGTPRANAIVTDQQLAAMEGRAQRRPVCPACGDNHAKPFQSDQMICSRCHAVFEPAEVSFVDAEKKEQSKAAAMGRRPQEYHARKVKQ